MNNYIPRVLNHPDEFKTGYRVILLMHRKKEGGPSSHDNKRVKKYITFGQKEFDEVMDRLLLERKTTERIYSTIDERDIVKGIRNFKQLQLDADYLDIDAKNNFYIDIKNRFLSALKKPNARKDTLFLIDIDEGDDEHKIIDELLQNSIIIVYSYNTKNGRHIITKPFNPGNVSFEVKKNALMLWAYGVQQRDLANKKL